MREEVVVDTSFLIYLLKEKKLDKLINGYDPYILDLALYEYLRGEFYIGRDAKKAKTYMEKLFNIIHLDNEIILKASELWTNLAREGALIPEIDILIGASCLVYDLPILTLDMKDFRKLIQFGLKIIEKPNI